MVYFVSIFFPFIGFFLIKKPVPGYFCLVLHMLVLLGSSMYPTPLIVFPLWFVLVLWVFFEINDYNTKSIVRKAMKKKALAKIKEEDDVIESTWKEKDVDSYLGNSMDDIRQRSMPSNNYSSRYSLPSYYQGQNKYNRR